MNRLSRAEVALLAAFLFWTLAGLIFTALRISPEAVGHWPLPGALLGFIQGCIHWGDPILILLAFANTHLAAAHAWGGARARRWALLVLTSALAVETLGVVTGFPFGSYIYTDRFGPRLGPVPFVIPLAWHIILTSALLLVRQFRPDWDRLPQALAAGLFACGYDYILEPFATRVKSYWLWRHDQIPLQNYLAWFGLGTLLILAFAPRAGRLTPVDARPGAIVAGTLLIFLAGRWASL